MRWVGGDDPVATAPGSDSPFVVVVGGVNTRVTSQLDATYWTTW